MEILKVDAFIQVKQEPLAIFDDMNGLQEVVGLVSVFSVMVEVRPEDIEKP